MQEHFRNRINEYALQWVKTLLAAVRNGSHIFESQYNSQRRAQADYKDRFFYELLQNARDVQGCSKIKIVLQNNQLLFCNNGKPIEKDNFEGLCEPDRSSKKNNNEQTGKYGIGKSSYYDIAAANHRIYSKATIESSSFDGYCFELASDKAIQYGSVLKDLRLDSKTPFGNNLIFTAGDNEYTIQEILQRDPDGSKRIQELEYVKKNLPIPITAVPDNINYFADKFSTVISFTPDDLEKVRDKLAEFVVNLPRILLFLPAEINEISVDIDEETTIFYRNFDDSISLYGEKRAYIGSRSNSENTEKRFFIWEKIASPEKTSIIYQDAPDNIKKRDPLKIIIALNPDDEAEEGFYFCDLPTEMKTGMNLYIDANFQLQSDRRSIRFDDPYNQKLLDFSAATIREIVDNVLASNNGVPCCQSAWMISKLLFPWRSKAQDSQIYRAISDIITVSNLSCMWAVENGIDSWTSPKNVVDTLDRVWTETITEREFYERSGVPILASEMAGLYKEFIIFFTGCDPEKIPQEVQKKILFELLIKNHLDQKKYLQTWQDVINNWSDLIDDDFAAAPIFLGKDGNIYQADSMFKPEEKGLLLGANIIADLSYSFVEIEPSFSDFISIQDEKLNSLFPSAKELNYKRCRELIRHQIQSESSKVKEIIFKVIIQDFSEYLSCQNLLDILLFPCNDNNWHPLEDIYQSKGWGARANAAIEFLKLCGVSEKFICLRSPSNKIWEGVSKENIKELVAEKLQSASIFEEYHAEIFVEKENISFHGVSALAEKILSESIPAEKNSYISKSTFTFFIKHLKEFTKEHILLLWDIVCADKGDINDMISDRLYFEKSSYHGKSYYVDNPLKTFLTTYAWVPGKDGNVYKVSEVIFLSKELRHKYPDLVDLEKIENSKNISEVARKFLLDLGAQQIEKESEIPYDEAFHCLRKDKKVIQEFIKSFWAQLAIGENTKVKLPQILPVIEANGKKGFASINSGQIYIADLESKKEKKALQARHSPCLDIDLDVFNNYMYWQNKNIFIMYSKLERKYLADNINVTDCLSMPFIEYKGGFLAFAILVASQNKKTLLEKMRTLSLFEADNLEQKIDGESQFISHCFVNNTFFVVKNKFAQGLTQELCDRELIKTKETATFEKLIDLLSDNFSQSDIVDFMEDREVNFDSDDVTEAKELLWGFGKAKKLALKFIPEVKGHDAELIECNSWKDIEEKILWGDFEPLKKFFTSPLSLVQRGKFLATDYKIDLREWNAACVELDEGCYVNQYFDSEFNKLRDKQQNLFLTCLLRQTAWNTDNRFLYNALQEWNDFDASDYANKFWQVDNNAFEEIINGFISQNYDAANQENAVNEPYTIFQKNLEAWESAGENAGENADIDIYSNDYFLKEYPAEYFEISPDEPEEDIVEAEEKAAVEESKPTSAPTVSAVKTPSVQAPSAHKVSIDTESVRSRVVKSTNERENHPSVRSVSHTNSEHQRTTASTAASSKKDISEIVNWKKWEVKFTAYKDITTANGGSNASAPHAQRNYSPSDSVSETKNLSDGDKAYIGKHGEECLFAYLNASFDNVKWVSTNNSQAIPGDDSLGYDFEIIDGEGKSQYIECKTTTGTTGTAEIHLGPTELSKAQECLPTENYSVYRVFPHGDQLQIVDLGNPLAEGNSVISFCGLKFRWRKK